jgi:uncharacterized protein YjbJ (UPF0337 family)
MLFSADQVSSERQSGRKRPKSGDIEQDGGADMGDKTDETKGRIKEAVGDLTDDESLKREGKVDRAGAKVKRKVNEGVAKVKDAIDRRTS